MGTEIFKDPSQLRVVTDRIHDRWFNPAEIIFSKDKGILTIPFVERTTLAGLRSFKEGKLIQPLGFLTIYHVASYTITDTENVGLYDFNKLTYDARSKRLVVHTGVPIGIEIAVTEFELSFEELPRERSDRVT